MSISDIGVISDSVVYVNDPNSGKVGYFSMGGSFIGTELLSRQFGQYGARGAIRHSVTSQDRKYTMHQAGEALFESKMGEEVVEFGPPLGGKNVMASGIVIGMMTTWREQLVYVPTNFPVIVQYNPDGTLAFARATPDFEQFEAPSLERDAALGVTFITGGRVHGTVSVFSDKIFVRVTHESKPCIDVYDAQSGYYEFSFETPSGSPAYVMNDRYYEVQDTTVAVWAIDGLTELLAQATL